MEHPLLLLATLLFVVGLAGALLRRSLLVTLLSFELCVLGAVLAFVDFAVARGDGAGLAKAAVLLFLGVTHAVLGAAATLAVFRRRATVNLDELRELRG